MGYPSQEDLQRDLDHARADVALLQDQLESARATRLSLRVQERTDHLTSVGTRLFFLEQLDLALAATVDQRPAVMMIDIDHFKAINDIYGHHAGDEVLIEIAARLRAVVNDRGVVSRFGGDEFALLLYEGTDLPAIAEELCKACREPIPAQAGVLSPHITIGAAVWDGHANEAEMLRYADLAMYQARQDRQQSAIFDWVTKTDLAVERAISDDLVAAIDGDLMELAFQPIVSLQSHHTMSFEVLSRWTHPVYGEVSPAVFVGIAERNQLISQLDHRIVERSATWLGSSVDLPPTINLSVNVSPLTLNQRFVDHVEATINRCNIDPTRLTFEITETASVRDLKLVQTTLTDLHKIGVQIALDDFGTGYSSLTYVHDLPISELKIDRSFVDRMLEERKARELVRAIIQVAQALDLRIVAEGIETPQQAELLRRMGCTHGQGYHFSRPVRQGALHPLIHERLPVKITGRRQSADSKIGLDGEQVSGASI